MKKNDIIKLNIEDLGTHGEGIGHSNGMAVFVPGAIPGDEITAGMTKVKKSYGYARLINVDRPSPNRVTPPCPIAGRCGGCQLQAMDYRAELRWKERHVRNLLIHLGGFEEALIDNVMEPIIGMKSPWRYRNKAQYPVGTDQKGNPIAGFYAQHSHRIIETEDCRIGAEENGRILQAVLQWMRQNHVKSYNEESGQGLIRHILIRQAVHTEETMVCLIANGARLPAVDSLVQKIREVSERTVSISLNTNRERTNVILGKETRTLWGEDTITDTIGDVAFRISPRSFFQVNPEQMEKLYRKALEYADLHGTERVYDLYCGIGTISLFLAKAAGHVTGVEIVPEAIKDAKENERRNRIGNADFHAGATEDLLPELIQKNPADVVVLDPPRKGCEESVLETILAAAPGRIVYVSCDPATLARDLKVLCSDENYVLKGVCPVDQFGHTVHCEVVCKLERKSERE